jgi:hypothetical protein
MNKPDPRNTHDIPLSSDEEIQELFQAENMPAYLAKRIQNSEAPLHLLLNDWYSALKLSRDWWRFLVENPEYKEYYWSIRDDTTGKSQPPKGASRRESRPIHAYFVKKRGIRLAMPSGASNKRSI